MEERELRVACDDICVVMMLQSHDPYSICIFIFKHCLYKFTMSLFVYFFLLSDDSHLKPGDRFFCLSLCLCLFLLLYTDSIHRLILSELRKQCVEDRQ